MKSGSSEGFCSSDSSQGPSEKKRRRSKNDNESLSHHDYDKQDDNFKKKKIYRPALPVDEVRSEIVDAIRKNPVSIIVGETGSGKSTQIPKICYEEGLNGGGVIGITQPRRVAAITLAKRVAFEMNMNLGEKVGYKVRFENTESETTELVYATDGILLREAFYDSRLERYSIIIVDEAHERSLHTDILLYILRLCYTQRSNSDNPLKLVIMSATLDADLFSKYFYDAPVFGIQGRTYPIELFYGNSMDPSRDDYLFEALCTVLQIHQEEPMSSGILVFLTGQEEIEIACKKAIEAMQFVDGEIVALPLYSGLSPTAQMRVFEPINDKNTRKVVFATNIAETSVTIPGIRIVVDTGKVKMRTFLADRKIDILRVENISRASATQRAGRAGREGPGKCYRLYPEKHFATLAQTTVPEVLRTNLSTVLLELHRIGMARVRNLSLISPPPQQSIDAAMSQLRLLEALQPPDKKERIHLTDMGLRLAAFPVDPPLARVLIAASHSDCLEEALTIVSFMSADTVFLTSSKDRESSNAARRKFETNEGDHCTMLNVYKGYRLARREKKIKEWCSANYVHERVLNIVFKIRRQLRDICMKETMNLHSCGTDTLKLRKALCTGLFMNACEYDRSQDAYRLVGSSATKIKIHPSSCLSRQRPTAFVFTDLVRTNELYARDITVVDIDWVKEILAAKKHLLKDL